MVPYKCCCFSARSAKGRIQGGAKIGHGGSPSSRNFFFRPDGYSDKPNGKQWSRSMWEEVLLFFVPFRSQIFDVFLDSHFCVFLYNFYRFLLCSKELYLHLFCVISMFFYERECLYQRFWCLKNFNEFFMHWFRWRKGGGGCTNACICMGAHSQPLLQNRLMDVTKLGRDEVLMTRTCIKVFRPDRPRGGSRAGPK